MGLTPYIFGAIAALMLTNVFAQIPQVGLCPSNVKAMDNFQLEKYLGKWYEAERYLVIFELGGKCVTAEYTLNPNGTVNVFNEQINKLSGLRSSILGYARFNNSEDQQKAALIVKFPSLPVQFDANYWVLDTDYTNFAVVWACEDVGPYLNARFAWILTRARNPPVEIMQRAYEVVDKNEISREYFIRTDQVNCPENH